MTRLTNATALGLILIGCPAFADITPRAAWDGMVQDYARMGATIEASSLDEAGDKLIAKGVVVHQNGTANGFVAEMGDVTFSQRGDGKVLMDMPDEATMSIDMSMPQMDEDDDEEVAAPEAIYLTLSWPGEEIVMDREGDAQTYEYRFPSLDIHVDRLNSITI